jgi:hypothetical protein
MPARRGLRSVPPALRRGCVAVVVAGGMLAVLGAHAFAAAVLLGAAWAWLARSRPAPELGPSPEYLRRLDASVEREGEMEYVASGEGVREYERLLSDLLAHGGREVTVVVGTAAGGCWRPLTRLSGRLRGGHSAHVPDEPERIAFHVGVGGVFYLDRDRFARGIATYRLCEDGALSIEDRDGDSLRLAHAPRHTGHAEDHARRR